MFSHLNWRISRGSPGKALDVSTCGSTSVLYTYPIRALHAAQNESQMSVIGSFCTRPSFFPVLLRRFNIKLLAWLHNWTLKALANEDTLLRTHCCPWCFLGCANWETFVADTKCFWTKSETFCVPDTKFVSATNVARAGKRGNIVSATMYPQQCVLVCQGL